MARRGDREPVATPRGRDAVVHGAHGAAHQHTQMGAARCRRGRLCRARHAGLPLGRPGQWGAGCVPDPGPIPRLLVSAAGPAIVRLADPHVRAGCPWSWHRGGHSGDSHAVRPYRLAHRSSEAGWHRSHAGLRRVRRQGRSGRADRCCDHQPIRGPHPPRRRGPSAARDLRYQCGFCRRLRHPGVRRALRHRSALSRPARLYGHIPGDGRRHRGASRVRRGPALSGAARDVRCHRAGAFVADYYRFRRTVRPRGAALDRDTALRRTWTRAAEAECIFAGGPGRLRAGHSVFDRGRRVRGPRHGHYRWRAGRHAGRIERRLPVENRRHRHHPRNRRQRRHPDADLFHRSHQRRGARPALQCSPDATCRIRLRVGARCGRQHAHRGCGDGDRAAAAGNQRVRGVGCSDCVLDGRSPQRLREPEARVLQVGRTGAAPGRNDWRRRPRITANPQRQLDRARTQHGMATRARGRRRGVGVAGTARSEGAVPGYRQTQR